MKNLDPDTLYTLDGFAAVLECHPRTVRRMMDEGVLAYYKTRAGRRVKGSDGIAYLEGQRVPAKAA